MTVVVGTVVVCVFIPGNHKTVVLVVNSPVDVVVMVAVMVVLVWVVCVVLVSVVVVGTVVVAVCVVEVVVVVAAPVVVACWVLLNTCRATAPIGGTLT